jgi:hypothetical protein
VDIEHNAVVLKPSGALLAKVIRNAIAPGSFTETLPILREVGGDAAHRLTASGGRQQPGATSGIIGYFPRTGRYGRLYCRAAHFTLRQPEKFERVLPLARMVNAIYAREADAYYSAQHKVVTCTHLAWIIRGTVFTTWTVNRNWQTALHNDSGDLPEGRGVLTCFYGGAMTGGELVLMKYGLVIPLRTGDVVIYDTHEYHCNLPLMGDGERLSCVFYYLSKMQCCVSPKEELQQLEHRKPGDPLFPAPDIVSVLVPHPTQISEPVRKHPNTTEEHSQEDDAAVPSVVVLDNGVAAGVEETSVAHARKIVIVLIGGNAAGKTTLRRQFTADDKGANTQSAIHNCWFANRCQCCGRQFAKKQLRRHLRLPGPHDPKRGLYAPLNVTWTVFGNGTAICGVPKNGADAVTNLSGINFALNHCLEESDVVIFDGVMSTKHLVHHLDNHPSSFATLWVSLDLSADTIVSQLSKRRMENGSSEPSDKTIRGVLRSHRSARVLWEYAKASYGREPKKFVVIPEGRTPQQIYQELNEYVTRLMAAGEMRLQEPECA